MKAFITGGSGFIGSNLAGKFLRENHQVKVFDNLSTGKLDFIKPYLNNPNFEFIEGDLKDKEVLERTVKGSDLVCHLAAHADVKSGFFDHEIDHNQNLEMTRNVLESIYKNNIRQIMFSSTSSVYGDASVHPTPEDYPFNPTSLYGATKAASESYIQAYSSYYDIRAFIFRFVSFTGENYTHGIVYDVLKKLKDNPSSIELFSDGTPQKSSLYVRDGVDAILKVINECKERINIYNIGNTEVHKVSDIVQWILEEKNQTSTKLNWLGKSSNWKGDNEFVQLDTVKLNKLGWTPRYSMEQGIKKTVQFISNYFNL